MESYRFVNTCSEITETNEVVTEAPGTADYVTNHHNQFLELENCLISNLLRLIVSADLNADPLVNDLSPFLTGDFVREVTSEESIQNFYPETHADWNEDTKRRCVDSLQIAALCSKNQCECCAFWKELREDIESSILTGTIFMPNVYRRVLSAIADLASDCGEFFCFVPWCYFFQSRVPADFPDQVTALRRFYVAADMDDQTFMSEDYETNQFLQVDNTVEWPSISFEYGPFPRTNLDFDVIEKCFGKFGQTSVTACAITMPPEYVRIHEYAIIEDTFQTWQTLQNLVHENIVRHHWIYFNAKLITVCIDYDHVNDNLADYLVSSRLEDVFARDLVGGLLSAVQFLHGHGILYLLWIASSITLTNGRTRARLADFSCAVVLSENHDWTAIMSDYLPAHIIPPEMHDGYIGTFTDVFGVGCLLSEIINRVHLFSDLDHQPYDSVRSQVRGFTIEKWLEDSNGIPGADYIFISKDERCTCEQLAEVLLTR